MDEARRVALEAKIARLSPEKQKLLRERLSGAATAATADELQPGLGGTGDFPMSDTQQGFWFLEQLDPGTQMFHLPLACRLHGTLKVAALRRTVEEIMRRHELLRARIVTNGGEAMFRVHSVPLPLEEIDLSRLPEDERVAAMHRIGAERFRAPFDFGVGPLLRLLVVHEKPEQNVVCLVFHHLICDGWSIELFFRELRELFVAFSAGEELALPEPQWRYADYVAWQQRHLASEKFADKLEYWRKTLEGAPPLTELPLDHPRSPGASHDGGLATIVIGREEIERIAGFSRREGLTPYMVYFGAFAALLARWSDQEEVVIGTPTFNRPRAEFEQIIGLFINTIVLRCDLAGNPALRSYLAERIRTRVLDAFAHQDVPFGRVVRIVNPDYNANHSPLFQVLFTYQNFVVDSWNVLGDLAVRDLEGMRSKATYDLTFELHNRKDGGITIHAEYATDLFDRSTIVRMLNQYGSLLYTMIDDPEVGVQSIALLSAAERRQLLSDWNQTDAAFPETSTYQELFREAARARPKDPAAREGSETVTYGELDARSDTLAALLASRGVGSDSLVALIQDRGIALLTSIIAAFKAGAGYVPIDPQYPPERIAQIVRRSQSPVVLAAVKLHPVLRKLEADGALGERTQVLCYEQAAAQPSVGPAPVVGRPTDLAYCIYTSGSTGTPKGAMIEQRGMLNHMFAKIRDLSLGEADVVAGIASPCFDISVWQYLNALVVGGRVVFFDDETTHSAGLFIQQLVTEQITVAEIVPSFLRVLLNELESMADRRPSLRRLRWLMLTGEALPVTRCNRWLELYPNVPLVNAYGPTECSDDVTHHFIHQPLPPQAESVPIGRPIANTRIYVVDRLMAPVPVGVRGEIVVGGVGVGRGYWNDPDRTREVFVEDPFVRAAGGRVYRTGDLGRFRADGTLEFLGRIDHQVKIRGFRIEPEEVEAVLGQHPEVREAAVLARADHGGDLRLVGYVVSETTQDLSAEDLREFLRDQLPEFMIPSVFVNLQALPLTPNGKLDRPALPTPPPAVHEVAAPEVPPSDLEEVLIAIYGEVLEGERIGVHDDFFDLGGHSLLAIDLVYRIQQAFKIQLSVRQFLGAPTVSKLANVIEDILHEGVISTLEVKDLEPEAELDPGIDPNLCSGAPPDPAARPQRVLLTGATGFLGSYLLHDLLEHTEVEVHCLVRAEDDKEARKRIRAALESRSIWRRSFAARIVPVAGDIDLPKLGQTRRQFDQLAREIDVIYHNAAWVNFLYSYAKLRATNVSGTQEVLRLATTDRAKPVHYVSTVAVFHSDGTGPRMFRENEEPGEIGVPAGGYAQTKWVAEKMVKAARARGLPVCIYRSPTISWHSRTGDANPDDLLCQLVKACIALGVVPKRDRMAALTPVDYVSRAIVQLSRQPESIDRNFHLINPQRVHLNDVSEWISPKGSALEHIDRDDWQMRLYEAAKRSPQSALYPLAYLMGHDRRPAGDAGAPSRDPVRPDFDCSNTLAALAGTPVQCPQVNAEYFGIMLAKLDGLDPF
ncbi:MAG: amino acid adenylation domain-containing protein [bacterium]|nr:amino acid adenylation domain-containing protein [bacterium]